MNTKPEVNPSTIRAFRQHLSYYLDQASTKEVTIHKRHQPQAVLMSFDRYNELLELKEYRQAVNNFTDRYDVQVDTQEFLKQNTAWQVFEYLIKYT